MRWKLVEWLTVKATDLSDLLLSSRNWDYTITDCSEMPKNSLGYGLYDYLEKTNLSYRPNLIRHDMKHILLDYEMKMPDELKIHAFLIGNKCYNLMGIIYLGICVLIVPEIIPELKQEYKRGQKAKCLKNIDLQQFVKQDIKNVRKHLLIY
jgi:ubiquinone biosynthesis protein Coq4